MQTFLPYSDFEKSATILDYKRLGKQRVEALQIANILASGRTTGGWVNHPAVRMWRGYLPALVNYGLVICKTWTDKGYKDTCAEKMLALSKPGNDMPSWMGEERLHRSHRSKLLSKFPEYYRDFFSEPDDLDYYWPE